MRRRYVPSSDGCEGLYVTPTLQGSRPGGVIAQAWATLLATGDDGYRQMARSMHAMTEQVMEAVASIDELALLVVPDAACIPIVSKDKAVGIYQVASLMEQRGWNLFTGQTPEVLTICLGESHITVARKTTSNTNSNVSQTPEVFTI